MPRTLRLRVRPWGDGLAVLLPPELAAEEGLRAGDVVEATLAKARDYGAATRPATRVTTTLDPP